MVAKESKGRLVNSSTFYWKSYNPSVMCVSYNPKKTKNVLMITTAHDEPVVDGGAKSKPEVVLFYNEQQCPDLWNTCVVIVCKSGVFHYSYTLSTYF